LGADAAERVVEAGRELAGARREHGVEVAEAVLLTITSM
jgi:hypothetical protein